MLGVRFCTLRKEVGIVRRGFVGNEEVETLQWTVDIGVLCVYGYLSRYLLTEPFTGPIADLPLHGPQRFSFRFSFTFHPIRLIFLFYFGWNFPLFTSSMFHSAHFLLVASSLSFFSFHSLFGCNNSITPPLQTHPTTELTNLTCRRQ